MPTKRADDKDERKRIVIVLMQVIGRKRMRNEYEYEYYESLYESV